MAGTIYLGSGGSATAEEALWRAMFAGRSRFTYWPFALRPDQLAEAESYLRDSLKGLDISIGLDIWVDLQGRSAAELASAELLFVGGGNTFHLLDHVRRHGFLDPVRDFVANGGDYYGGSAGAILAGTDIAVAEGHDDNDLGLSDLSALGLVAEFTVWPHFTPNDVDVARAWCSRNRRVVLGVPERAGLMVQNGSVQVLGTEEVWQVTGTDVSMHTPGEQ